MKFIHRLGYYLGGFSIGLIVLAFFLSGKKTSCDYGPNSRTIKNISIKQKEITDAAKFQMKDIAIDSLQLEALIKTGNVNFSESDTKNEDCKTYLIESMFNEIPLNINVINCDSIATINSIKLRTNN